MNQEKNRNFVLKMILILVFSIVVGYLFLSLTYFIPARFYDDREIGNAVGVFSAESEYPVEPFSGRTLDNFSDALMLSEAITYIEGKTPFEMAVETAFQGVDGVWGPMQAFIKLNTDESYEGIISSYSRYWNGYLLFLKPLFAFFTYSQIRNINTYALFALLLAVIVLLYDRNRNLLVPFLVMILFLAPTAVVNSLHYSSDCYLMLVGIMLFLWNPHNVFRDRKNLYILFLLLGIWTSFLDLLSAPTISVTVLLCLVCENIYENDHTEKDSWKMVITCAGMWFVGYAVMWSGKWVIALCVQKQTFFDSLIHSIRFRSASVNEQGESIARLQGLTRNIGTLFSIKYINLVLAGTVCFYLRYLFMERRDATGTGRRKEKIWLYVIPFAIPLLWMAVLSNQTYNHHWFTYRMLAPCVFCILSMLSDAYQNRMLAVRKES